MARSVRLAVAESERQSLQAQLEAAQAAEAGASHRCAVAACVVTPARARSGLWCTHQLSRVRSVTG